MTVQQLRDTLSHYPSEHDVVVKLYQPDQYDEDGELVASAHYELRSIKGTRHELKHTVLETD